MVCKLNCEATIKGTKGMEEFRFLEPVGKVKFIDYCKKLEVKFSAVFLGVKKPLSVQVIRRFEK